MLPILKTTVLPLLLVRLINLIFFLLYSTYNFISMYILFIVHISLLFFFYFSEILALMRYSLIRVEIKFTTTTTNVRAH